MLLFCCYSHRVRPSLSYVEQVQAAGDPFFFFLNWFFSYRANGSLDKQKIRASPGERQSDLTAQPLFFTCMLGCRTDTVLTQEAPPPWHTHTPPQPPPPLSPESHQVLVQSPVESLCTLTGAATVIIRQQALRLSNFNCSTLAQERNTHIRRDTGSV